MPLLIILVLAIGYHTMHKPLPEEPTELEPEKVRLQDQAHLDQAAAQALIYDLEEQLAELRPLVPQLENALPTSLQSSDTLELVVTRTAHRNNMQLDNFRTTGPRQNDDLLSLTVNVNARGTY